MISKEILKGSVKTIILKLLAENEKMYGYELTRKIEEISGGSIRLTFGALYPLLHKLEDEGDVSTESDIVNSRTRIYYRLTPKGTKTASLKIKEMKEFTETIQKLLQ